MVSCQNVIFRSLDEPTTLYTCFKDEKVFLGVESCPLFCRTIRKARKIGTGGFLRRAIEASSWKEKKSLEDFRKKNGSPRNVSMFDLLWFQVIAAVETNLQSPNLKMVFHNKFFLFLRKKIASCHEKHVTIALFSLCVSFFLSQNFFLTF